MKQALLRKGWMRCEAPRQSSMAEPSMTKFTWSHSMRTLTDTFARGIYGPFRVVLMFSVYSMFNYIAASLSESCFPNCDVIKYKYTAVSVAESLNCTFLSSKVHSSNCTFQLWTTKYTSPNLAYFQLRNSQCELKIIVHNMLSIPSTHAVIFSGFSVVS